MQADSLVICSPPQRMRHSFYLKIPNFYLPAINLGLNITHYFLKMRPIDCQGCSDTLETFPPLWSLESKAGKTDICPSDHIKSCRSQEGTVLIIHPWGRQPCSQ